ncbi:DUF6896 domain-containing protein [Paenibacillus amylolyticus]|uniref:DUF6896 domain-containing protein n=1 Tax=Paenibacillus amylolyticus TaxID=1451 RepID=A0A100VP42_PAEAM|nr:hypothetical protein [Paenibacillus amylolyticus]GAS83457.1 unknown protein [Paenibacillus amylolyticus]
MKAITQEITEELLTVMDIYQRIARQLIEQLILETDQPDRMEILAGAYDMLTNADVIHGGEELTGDWFFDVHGEHCMFQNTETGQTLEVSLGSPEDVGNMDPYFFYNFIKTTPEIAYLTAYFENPFKDMLDFFERLQAQHVLIHVHGVEYRKVL